MGKLPKSMQKKKKRARALRTRGTKSIRKENNPTPKGLNRQMRRRLQQQGLDGMEQITAERVIIETGDEEDLVIEAPQVIKVDQQGVEAYQVIGTANSVPAGSVSSSEKTEPIAPSKDFVEEEPAEEIKVEIKDQDIQLVSLQTGVSSEVARNELEKTNGDLAKAIINLKTK